MIRPGLFCIKQRWEYANQPQPVQFSKIQEVHERMIKVVSSSSANSSNSDDDVTLVEDFDLYESNFSIHEHPNLYFFKIQFERSGHNKFMASFSLLQTLARPYAKDEKIDSEKLLADMKSDNIYLPNPSVVWVTTNGDTKNHRVLKRSSTTNTHWTSGTFDGSLIRPDGASLTCWLWLEFEEFTGSEKRVVTQLKQWYLLQKNCDIQFVLEGNRTIGAHKSILSARSSIFAAIFMEENLAAIHISDIQLDVFIELLHHIYAGQLSKPLTESSAQQLYLVADRYSIDDVKRECANFLVRCIYLENVVSLIIWAYLHSVEELLAAAIDFVTLHPRLVCALEDWMDFTRSYPSLCVMITRQIVGIVKS